MTTTVLADPRPPRGTADSAGVPFLRLVRVESRKLVDTRGGRTMLAVIGFVTVGVIALLMFTSDPAGLTFQNLAFAAAVPQALLLPVMGVLSATSEWSQRSALVTFTLEPRRLRVATAKLVAAVLAGLLAVPAALVVAALANLAGLLWLDGNGSWAIQGAVLGGATLMQVIGVVQGVAFGLAIVHSAAAIASLFVLPVTWAMLGMLVDGLQRVAPWLDLTSSTTPLLDGAMRGSDWAHLATACGVWLLLPLLIGLLRLTRREIK